MRARPRRWSNPFGDGTSGLKIVDLLVEAYGVRKSDRDHGAVTA
jgi:hypothetical protein